MNELNPRGQARALSDIQQTIVLAYLEHTAHPIRNKCMFLFSVKAGLRAIEIALIEWGMVYDLDGNLGTNVTIQPKITKNGRSRIAKPPIPHSIPLHSELKKALIEHHQKMGPEYTSPTRRIFISQQGYKFDRKKVASFFWLMYNKLGFHKCSSHSGRRTFITNGARKISRVGGSLLDIQKMAGHRSLQTTQLYIEENEAAKRKVIELL